MSYGEDFDLAQEPRKVFVNFLIFNMKMIELKLYVEGSPSDAIRPLKGLIDSLDDESRAKLKKQRDLLGEYEANLMSCTRENLEQIYSEINGFLHGTYLKEVRFAKPRFSSDGKLEVPDE